MTNNETGAGPSGSTSNLQSDKNQEVKFEITDKLRILCLHGYRQNGDAFKSKLGSFRKFVSRYAELVFIDAPHVAAPLEAGGDKVPEQRSWWANKDDGTFKGTNKGGPAYGFEESLRLVEDTWKKQGPFQGLLGFSQGACFVGLLCGLAKRKMTSVKPEFAILSSGFLSGSLVHKSAYEDCPIIIPALHIYGTSDEIIPKEMSQELMGLFSRGESLEHIGGHYFPATAQQKQTYVEFIRDRLQDYLENLELQNSLNSSIIEEQVIEEVGMEENSDESD